MIAYIDGKLTYKSPTNVHLDIGGLAYDVQISLNSYAKIESLDEVRLFTHLIVREDAHTLFGFVEEENTLKGLVLQKVMVYNGRIVPLENETEELRADLIVSSIGSLPEQIDGLPYEYSSLKMRKHVDYHVFGYDNVFAVGNAVTGRGNIQESKQHGQKITRRIIDEHLTDDALETWLNNMNDSIKETVSQNVDSIIEEIRTQDIQPENIIQSILAKTKAINNKNGYSSYSEWTERHLPVRLEDS